MSLGKKLGTIAFYVTEILILVFSAWIMVKGHHQHITAIIGSQTGLMTVVWASKASSNFAKKERK